MPCSDFERTQEAFMNDFKKQRKQKRFDDIKHTLRQAESIVEVVALSLI